MIPGLGVHNIAYRDTSGRLHELWRNAQGVTGATNLTASIDAPTTAQLLAQPPIPIARKLSLDPLDMIPQLSIAAALPRNVALGFVIITA